MAFAVIGAGYGDEGKGQIVDYLTRKTGCHWVARFNGGSQAGHTVVDNGRRHVFGHIGSGTFAGAETYLSSHFIVNPLLLSRERQQLERFGLYPTVYVHPDAKVTTIYDMAVNRLRERALRHGSCGLGIHETVARSTVIPIFARDLTGSYEQLAKKLREIQKVWVPTRISSDMNVDSAVGIALHTDATELAEKMMDAFSDTRLWQPSAGRIGGGVVFEGAQGLGLDRQLGHFPHVTDSITGLMGACEAAGELNLTEISPVYVTRAYATRHGAGPLAYEGVEFCDRKVIDTTNLENTWQGKLRFAPLDVAVLKHRIEADISRGHRGKVKLNNASIALTCVDQVGDRVKIALQNKLVDVEVNKLPEFIEEQVGLKVRFVSRGPGAKSVELR